MTMRSPNAIWKYSMWTMASARSRNALRPWLDCSTTETSVRMTRACDDVARYIHEMSTPRVADLSFRVLNAVHRTILHATHGRIGATAFGMSVVELHTVGRMTGLARSTILTAPVSDGVRFVLVASKGGDDRDPDWYRNIVAQPNIDLTIGGRRTPMRARIATAEEKTELWPQVVAAYRSYGGYRRRTKRDIPIVICDPR